MTEDGWQQNNGIPGDTCACRASEEGRKRIKLFITERLIELKSSGQVLFGDIFLNDAFHCIIQQFATCLDDHDVSQQYQYGASVLPYTMKASGKCITFRPQIIWFGTFQKGISSEQHTLKSLLRFPNWNQLILPSWIPTPYWSQYNFIN